MNGQTHSACGRVGLWVATSTIHLVVLFVDLLGQSLLDSLLLVYYLCCKVQYVCYSSPLSSESLLEQVICPALKVEVTPDCPNFRGSDILNMSKK